MMESLVLTLGNILANGIDITMDGNGKVCFDLEVRPAIVTAAPDSAAGTLIARAVTIEPDGTSWNGEEIKVSYNWAVPGSQELSSQPAPKVGDIGLLVGSKYFVPCSTQTAINGNEYSVTTCVNNKIILEDGASYPVAVCTSKGNCYPIEKGSITSVAGTWVIDVSRYLAYDNEATFTAPWRVICSGGVKGDSFSPDARGTIAEINLYADRPKGFAFFAVDEGCFYFKTSDVVGEWGDPVYLGGRDGEQGIPGKNGNDGATFIPNLDADGNLSWTNNKNLTNPATVNIKGSPGKNGTAGKDGTNGVTPHIGSNGNWYTGDTDTGISAQGPKGDGGTLESIKLKVSSATNNLITISSDKAFPVAVFTDKGNCYPVEKGSITATENGWILNISRYLAYDNSSSFTPDWYVYLAGGVLDAIAEDALRRIENAVNSVDGNAINAHNISKEAHKVLFDDVHERLEMAEGDLSRLDAVTVKNTGDYLSGPLKAIMTDAPVISTGDTSTVDGGIVFNEKASIYLVSSTTEDMNPYREDDTGDGSIVFRVYDETTTVDEPKYEEIIFSKGLGIQLGRGGHINGGGNALSIVSPLAQDREKPTNYVSGLLLYGNDDVSAPGVFNLHSTGYVNVSSEDEEGNIVTSTVRKNNYLIGRPNGSLTWNSTDITLGFPKYQLADEFTPVLTNTTDWTPSFTAEEDGWMLVFVNKPDNTKIDAYIGSSSANAALAGRIACSLNPEVSGSVFLPIKAGQHLYVMSWHSNTTVTLICRFYPI